MTQKKRWPELTHATGFRILVFFFCFLPFMQLPSRAQQPEKDEAGMKQKTIEYFNQKQYEQTLTSIDPLLNLYPKDPELNYYSGVSLTEIGRNLNKAIEQLELASLSKGPQEVYYYLGKALYQNKKFSEALKFFQRYEKVGLRENQKSLKLNQWLLKSEEASGETLPAIIPGRWEEPYIEQVTDAFYQKKEIKQLLNKQDIQELTNLDKMNQAANRNMKEAWDLEKGRNKQAIASNAAKSQSENQRVLKKIDKLDQRILEKKTMAFTDFQTTNDGKYQVYNQNIEKILQDSTSENHSQIKQYKEDASINYGKALALRKQVNVMSNVDQKFDLLSLANAHELLALDNQKKAIGIYAGLVPTHKKLPENPAPSLAKDTSNLQNRHKELSFPKDEIAKPAESERVVNLEKKDKFKPHQSSVQSVFQSSVKKENIDSSTPETSIEKPIVKTKSDKPAPANKFTILPTPEYNKHLSIVIDEPMPEGTFYKIQIGVFKNLKNQAYFKGIQPISAESIKSNGAIRFYGGLFSQYEVARSALRDIKKLGFKDAYINAFHDGIKISIKEAKFLESTNILGNTEKETRRISGSSLSPEQRIHYKIQIGVFSKPVNPAFYQTFKNYAGEKELETGKKANGINVYSIGIFTNFESANSFKEDLVNKGLKDAFIIAYEGDHIIPVSEALKKETGK